MQTTNLVQRMKEGETFGKDEQRICSELTKCSNAVYPRVPLNTRRRELPSPATEWLTPLCLCPQVRGKLPCLPCRFCSPWICGRSLCSSRPSGGSSRAADAKLSQERGLRKLCPRSQTFCPSGARWTPCTLPRATPAAGRTRGGRWCWRGETFTMESDGLTSSRQSMWAF